jgi:hypothetical protein
MLKFIVSNTNIAIGNAEILVVWHIDIYIN